MLVATVIWLSLLLAGGVALMLGYLAAAQKANAAADLVALSAAAAQVSGEGACAGAARMAVANGVRLSACQIGGDPLEFAVVVEIAFPIRNALPGLPGELTAHATAGRSTSAEPG